MTRQHFKHKKIFHIFLRLVIGTRQQTKKTTNYIKSKKLLYCIVLCRMDDIISEQGGPFRHVATCRHSKKIRKEIEKMMTSFSFLLWWYETAIHFSSVECMQVSFRLIKK
jgi:hypothetical protein